MDEPAEAWVRLEGRAGEIFAAWQERCHEIVEKEGKPLDPLGDGMPVLVGIVHNMCADLNSEKRLSLVNEVWQAFEESMKLATSEGEGEA